MNDTAVAVHHNNVPPVGRMETSMALNKKTVDDINAQGKRVLVRCDFNVPLKVLIQY